MSSCPRRDDWPDLRAIAGGQRRIWIVNRTVVLDLAWTIFPRRLLDQEQPPVERCEVGHVPAARVPTSLEEATRFLSELESLTAERARWLRYADAIWAPRPLLPTIQAVAERYRRVQETLAAWPEVRLGERERALIDFLIEQAVKEWMPED